MLNWYAHIYIPSHIWCITTKLQTCSVIHIFIPKFWITMAGKCSPDYLDIAKTAALDSLETDKIKQENTMASLDKKNRHRHSKLKLMR